MSKSIIEVTTKTKSNKLKHNVSLRKLNLKSRKRKQTKRNNRKTKYIGGGPNEIDETEIKQDLMNEFIKGHLFIKSDETDEVEITENGRKNTKLLFSALKKYYAPHTYRQIETAMLTAKTKSRLIEILMHFIINNKYMKYDDISRAILDIAFFSDEATEKELMNKISHRMAMLNTISRDGETSHGEMSHEEMSHEEMSHGETLHKSDYSGKEPKQPKKQLSDKQRELLAQLPKNSKEQMGQIKERRINKGILREGF